MNQIEQTDVTVNHIEQTDVTVNHIEQTDVTVNHIEQTDVNCESLSNGGRCTGIDYIQVATEAGIKPVRSSTLSNFTSSH